MGVAFFKRGHSTHLNSYILPKIISFNISLIKGVHNE